MDDEILQPHFRLSEFRCPCCGDVNHDNAARLAARLEPIRIGHGVMPVLSSFRCPNHNHAVGGRLFSEHLAGLAADIAVTGDPDRYHLVKVALELGIRRLGIHRRFVHIGIGPDHQDVMWVYD